MPLADASSAVSQGAGGGLVANDVGMLMLHVVNVSLNVAGIQGGGFAAVRTTTTVYQSAMVRRPLFIRCVVSLQRRSGAHPDIRIPGGQRCTRATVCWHWQRRLPDGWVRPSVAAHVSPPAKSADSGS